MNLHHFYHIYADGNCEQPIREHIKALKEYGLYDALTTFAIGIVGSQQKRDEVKHCIDTLDVKYIVCAEADSGWEQVTQIPLWEFCKSNDGFVLYAHTKGASNPENVNVRWRRSMTWFNVCQWEECVKQLEDHDAVGCHWIEPLLEGMPEHIKGNFMFAGTFWWARCSLVATFIKPPLTHRHEAEGWIGYKNAEQPFRVHDFTPYFPNQGPFKDDWL